MPAKVKVRIVAGRDLPIMDRSSELTDAFVEIKFGSTTYKTDVYRKSLNPQWNTEWYRFEVDDEVLQDEPLQIRVLDHDTYSSHDAIGKVYIDLNPLLMREHGTMISGWFPIYDTMHGIRGELSVIVKVDLFSDFNKFRQSSCGVHFFCTSGVPYGYRVQAIHGFVEELVVNDDPEYQWIDKIRSQRASNEARQILFSKLSGELQRKIGLKVLEMGGTAVLGYRQHFDLEGESGVVVRAIGTSVTLAKLSHYSSPGSSPIRDLPLPDDVVNPSSPTNITPTKLSSSPAKSGIPFSGMARRSSESDLSTPPKGGSQAGSSGGSGSAGMKSIPFHRPVLQQNSIDMLEYPFFTMKTFPPGFLVHIGGVVSARSVKLLDRIHNPDEPETRDMWWIELRTEIRSHARAMGCHAVVGYSEHTTICDELIILSSCGTAAIVNLRMDTDGVLRQTALTQSLDRANFEKESTTVEYTGDCGKYKKLHVDVNLANQAASHSMHVASGYHGEVPMNCGPCHVPYNESSLPFPVNLMKCLVCKRNKVPDVLFTTVNLPAEVPFIGKGCLVQARICRPKKEAKGEHNAKEVSDCLPFMEYELHNQLLNKLKMKGMNCLFGLKIQFVVGEEILVAVATATAVYAAPLPSPPLPKIVSKDVSGVTEANLQDMQKKIIETVNYNKETYGLQNVNVSASDRIRGTSTDEEDELNDVDLASGNKDTFVLEVDDAEDVEVVSVLLDPPVPDGFDISTTDTLPGVTNMACNLQMFTRVWRGPLAQRNNRAISNIFDSLTRSIFFKLRAMTPCVVCNVDYDVELDDEDDIQVTVTGICIGLGEPATMLSGIAEIESLQVQKQEGAQSLNSSIDNEDMMFQMDVVSSGMGEKPTSYAKHGLLKTVTQPKKVEKRVRYYSGPRLKLGIELTPLPYVPGGRIEHYLGHLNFFIIRETTSVRESGGLNGFMHSFIAEMMAICRGHVAALGGNALVAFRLTECVLEDSRHKNQSQSLVNTCGDVVQVLYQVDLLNSSVVGNTGARAGSISPLIQDFKTVHASSPKQSPKTPKQKS